MERMRARPRGRSRRILPQSGLLQNPLRVASRRSTAIPVVSGFDSRYLRAAGALARQCAGRVFVGSFFFTDRRARSRAIAAYSTIRPMPEKTAVCIVMAEVYSFVRSYFKIRYRSL